MPREPDPKRKQAFEVYKEHNGEIALVDLAKQLGVTDGTVRGWKSKDKWESKLNGTFQTKNTERSEKTKVKNKKSQKKSSSISSKKSVSSKTNKSAETETNTQTKKSNMARFGNKNAVGGKGGNGGPVGNKFALVTGEYETIVLDDIFNPVELEILSFDINEYAELKQQLNKLMIREYRMFNRIKKLEEIHGGLKITSVTSTTGESRGGMFDTDTKGKSTTVKDVLDDIMRVEESLTRVQANIFKVIERIHKYSLDYERLAIEKERVEIYKNKMSGIVDLDELLFAELGEK